MRVARLDHRVKADTTEKVDVSRIDSIIEKYRGKKGSTIPLLQGAQDEFGYIPREVFEHLSTRCGIELSEMYGVATFYAQFRLFPVGKHIIKVCHGTACHVQQANKITDALVEALGVADGGTTEDRLFTLESVACLGCCSLAPVMMIGDSTYGKLTGQEAVKIVKNLRITENEAEGE